MGSYSWSLSSSGKSTLRRAAVSSGTLTGVLDTLSKNQLSFPPVSTTSLKMKKVDQKVDQKVDLVSIG